MEILREVKGYELNKGNGPARGLFNLFHTKTEKVSYWFDEETKDELMEMSDEEFILQAKIMIFSDK